MVKELPPSSRSPRYVVLPLPPSPGFWTARLTFLVATGLLLEDDSIILF